MTSGTRDMFRTNIIIIMTSVLLQVSIIYQGVLHQCRYINPPVWHPWPISTYLLRSCHVRVPKLTENGQINRTLSWQLCTLRVMECCKIEFSCLKPMLCWNPCYAFTYICIKYLQGLIALGVIITRRPRQTSSYLQTHFFNLSSNMVIHISLKYIFKVPICNKSYLNQIMIWHWQGDKLLSWPMITQIRIHIYFTPPQKNDLKQWTRILISPSSIFGPPSLGTPTFAMQMNQQWNHMQ